MSHPIDLPIATTPHVRDLLASTIATPYGVRTVALRVGGLVQDAEHGHWWRQDGAAWAAVPTAQSTEDLMRLGRVLRCARCGGPAARCGHG